MSSSTSRVQFFPSHASMLQSCVNTNASHLHNVAGVMTEVKAAVFGTSYS